MGQIEIRPQVIRAELAKTLKEVDAQIEQVRQFALDHDISVYSLRDANGGWTYIPLLAAKAQCLSGIAQLQTPK